jgi:23S rRNA pseudouridine2604 synthase
MAASSSVRLELVLARLGLCSRREANALILAGRVLVDGADAAALSPRRVAPDAAVTLTARPANELPLLSVALHKPISFHSAPGHRSVFAQRQARDLLVPSNRSPDCRAPVPPLPRVRKLSVAGRLDADSSGLLIFSQSGAVCRHVIGGGSAACAKEYAIAFAAPHDWPEWRVDEAVARLGVADGSFLMEGDDRPLRPVRVAREGARALRLTLSEGRHRQIRRMCEAVGLRVEGLRRERVGGLSLEGLGLRSGQWRLFTADQLFDGAAGGDEDDWSVD